MFFLNFLLQIICVLSIHITFLVENLIYTKSVPGRESDMRKITDFFEMKYEMKYLFYDTRKISIHIYYIVYTLHE